MKAKILIPNSELINTEWRKFIIEIRLDDECKNGHIDFAITAMAWYKSNKTTECDCCGCMHDEILKIRPDLKPFIDLHLCDRKGVPMYAIENGFYYLKEGKTDVLYNHLKLNSNEELSLFKNCPDKLYFQYLIEKLELPKRWLNEAIKAIKVLEDITGETFNDTSTKDTYIPLSSEQIIDIETKIKDGFYSESAINQRKSDALKEVKERKIKELRNEASKKIREITAELKLKMYVLNFGLPIDNMIFYTHTKELVFNWKNYDKKITQQQFESFKKSFERTSMYKNADVLKISLNS